MDERRRANRARLGRVLFNKYIDGFPHMAELVDLSASGMLVRRIHEPALPRDFFPVELGIPGTAERMWLWARRVWTSGDREALRFVGIDPIDRARLGRIVERARRAA
jgi:hypothetical protein